MVSFYYGVYGVVVNWSYSYKGKRGIISVEDKKNHLLLHDVLPNQLRNTHTQNTKIMAAISMACVSSQCLSLSSKLHNLSISSSVPFPNSSLKSLTFSANLSHSSFPQGCSSLGSFQRRGFSVVCEVATQNKADSAAKRTRQAETRRLRNKARKSEVKTRMRKVFEALDALKKKTDATTEELVPIDNLIAEAYSAIDKAVVKGSLHRNTGARRKSRLARNKKVVEIHHGWYTPAPESTTV